MLANIFVEGLRYFEHLRSESFQSVFFLGLEIDFAPIFFIVLAFCIVLLIKKFIYSDNWGTPADSIYLAQNRNVKPNFRQGFATIASSFISLAGGASLGQYGPLVYLGGVFGSITKLFSINIGRDVLIGCAVASAISSGFSAPVAAVIFAHEAVLRHYSGVAVAFISISSVISFAISKIFFEAPQIFHIKDFIEFNPSMVFINLASGIVFGIAAIFLIKSVMWVLYLSTTLKSNLLFFKLIGLFLLVLISQTAPEAIGLGITTVNDLLSQAENSKTLFVLFFTKIIASITSLAIGFSGGFVGPALFIGATLGGLIYHLLEFFGFNGSGAVLTISGAAAVAGTVFGSPLAMVILVLELTQSYSVALSTMLSIVSCSLLFHLFLGHSLFDLQLLKRGIDLSKGRTNLEIGTISIRGLAKGNYSSFKPNCTAKAVFFQMKSKNIAEAYCVDSNGQFFGKISFFDLDENSKGKIKDFAKRNCLIFSATMSAEEAMRHAVDFIGETIPVIDTIDDIFLGVVSEGDLFKSYLEINDDVQHIEKD